MNKLENFFFGQLKSWYETRYGKKIFHDSSRKRTGYEYFTCTDLAQRDLPKLLKKIHEKNYFTTYR